MTDYLATSAEPRTNRRAAISVVGAAIGALFVSGVAGVVTVRPSSQGGAYPSGDAATLVAAAPAVARRAGTLGMSLTLHVTAGGRTVTIRSEGSSDVARNISSATLHIPGLSGPLTLESFGKVAYLKVPATRLAFTGGRHWVKLDATQFASDGLGTGADLLSNLDVLSSAGSTVRVVGHEAIRGLATTHYHADLDLLKVFDRLPPGLKAQASSLPSSVHGPLPPLRIDTWLAGSGLPLRTRSMLSIQGLQETVDVELRELPAPLVLAQPPDSDATVAPTMAAAFALVVGQSVGQPSG